MKNIGSFDALNEFGRTRLSENFFMRDFLYSEISNFHAIPNIPDNPELAIKVGRRLCEELLEPLNASFGRIAIRSSFRSSKVNAFGNENKLNCASNESNHARHIWDMPDSEGLIGATACIAIPGLWIDTQRAQTGGRWPTGFTIICLIANWNFFTAKGCAPSISVGMKSRRRTSRVG